MLSRIVIDGYKCIDKVDLELKNFTLLSGINSSGKSSIIQAILRVMHAQGKLPREIGADLGKYADIRNAVRGNKRIDFEVEVQDKYGNVEKSSVRIVPAEGTERADFIMSEEKKQSSSHGWYQYVNKCKIIYLSVERVGVQSFYPLSLGDPRMIGDRGEYAYSCLALCGQDVLAERDFACKPEIVGLSMNNQVNYWLEYLMGFHIQTTIVQDVDQVVVTYSNAGNNRYYRAQNVGTGITYMSMLIIAALSCQKGDTLIIENPEIHLHPRAQARFMELVAFMSGRGLQMILETHSDHIYNGMRKCIKKKEMDRKQAIAYYLELDENMQTKVTKIRMNDQGAEENHPRGLFDQFDDDLDELLGM